jgi:outer membrane lipoprotein-sorting protein
MAGMATESLYEISGDDKYHMASKLNGKENSNVISIGDTTYTLDYSDNKWWKQVVKPVEDTEGETEDEVDDMAFNSDDALEDTTTYTFIAKEACGDLMCFKYEMVSPEMQDAKQFIWFDDRDYLMRKMRMEMGKQGNSESIYSYDNVSIVAPSPVKEGDPYSTGSQGSGYTEAETQKMMQQYQQNTNFNNYTDDTSDNQTESPVEDTSSDEF